VATIEVVLGNIVHENVDAIVSIPSTVDTIRLVAFDEPAG
jgi:hypothetical protein